MGKRRIINESNQPTQLVDAAGKQGDIVVYSLRKNSRGMHTRVFICHDIQQDRWICGCQSHKENNSEPLQLKVENNLMHSEEDINNENEYYTDTGRAKHDYIKCPLDDQDRKEIEENSTSGNSMPCANVVEEEKSPCNDLSQRFTNCTAGINACSHISTILNNLDQVIRVQPMGIREDIQNQILENATKCRADTIKRVRDRIMQCASYSLPIVYQISNFTFAVRCDVDEFNEYKDNPIEIALQYVHTYFFPSRRHGRAQPQKNNKEHTRKADLRFSCHCSIFRSNTRRPFKLRSKRSCRCSHFFLTAIAVESNPLVASQYRQVLTVPSFQPEIPPSLSAVVKNKLPNNWINDEIDFLTWMESVAAQISSKLSPLSTNQVQIVELCGSDECFALFRQLLNCYAEMKSQRIVNEHPMFYRKGVFLETIWHLKDLQELKEIFTSIKTVAYFEFAYLNMKEVQSSEIDHTDSRKRVIQFSLDLDSAPLIVIEVLQQSSDQKELFNSCQSPFLATTVTVSFLIKKHLLY